MRSLWLPLVLALSAAAEPPAFYRTVSRVSWVVSDADAAARAWQKLGLAGVESRGEIDLPVHYRGQAVAEKVKWVSGWLGSVAVDYIQPLAGRNAYAEFLHQRGEGVMGLLHEVTSREAMDREVERMRRLGVGVLQRGQYVEGGTTVDYLYFDTAPLGAYSLGLIYFDGDGPSGSGSRLIAQFAFAVGDLAPVSAYWQKLGWPAMEITHPQLRDLRYRGQPTRYAQDLGWYRFTSVPYEWCMPPRGVDTVYGTYLEQHGEGFQHLAFTVKDMDEAIRQSGYPAVQSGAWGEPGQSGSGRFAYLDTPAGVTVELLWNQPEPVGKNGR